MTATQVPIVVPCPHCDALNRMARDRLADGGRCGVCHKRLFTGQPVALSKERFERHLDKGDVPLLIDFWAPWCGPCRTMAPEFERAAPELEPGFRLVKVNVDDEPELAVRFIVRSIPMTTLAFRGREIVRLTGARPTAELVRWARAHTFR
jgi:thioredoxin 2